VILPLRAIRLLDSTCSAAAISSDMNWQQQAFLCCRILPERRKDLVPVFAGMQASAKLILQLRGK
jgi:hypothetical protein